MDLKKIVLVALATLMHPFAETRAQELVVSDGTEGGYFGSSVGLSGSTGLIGAYGANSYQGAAYLYRNLATVTGTIYESAKLIASDGAADDGLGGAVSLSESTGLIGAFGANSYQGAAYLYRNLATVTGTIYESAKLIASDGAANDYFGVAVSLSESTGLIGAYGANSYQGAAYLYRNLATVTGTISESAKLIASDGAASDLFGLSVSLSGSTGLIGAQCATIGSNSNRGAAYLYRNLATVTGTIYQSAKLIASDGAEGDQLGRSVSLSGSTGLIGANCATIGSNSSQGAAYLYRNLATVTGTIYESAKLIASDGAAYDYLGNSISLSGSTGLIGACNATIGSNSSQGAAYLYQSLATVTGTITESVKLVASGGAANDCFGSSVSLNGDTFVVGAAEQNNSQGKSYAGTVSSMTTLDVGNATRTISGISFISNTDWIVGQTTSANQVTLSKGDSATVVAFGKAVYIGKNAGSNNNKLDIAGALAANEVLIGSTAGNTGNILQLESTASFATTVLKLAIGNELRIQGDQSATTDLFTYLGETTLDVWTAGNWLAVDSSNFDTYFTSAFDGDYTSIQVVPEPSTWAMALGGFGLLLFSRRLRHCSKRA